MTLICMVGGRLLARSTGDKTTDQVELGGQCILDTLRVVDILVCGFNVLTDHIPHTFHTSFKEI